MTRKNARAVSPNSIRPSRCRNTISKAAEPKMLASEVASGMPQVPTWYSAAASTVLTARLPTAIAVGVHGVWRLKKARFSISITPLNVSPSEKAASALAVTVVSSTVHLPCW